MSWVSLLQTGILVLFAFGYSSYRFFCLAIVNYATTFILARCYVMCKYLVASY